MLKRAERLWPAAAVAVACLFSLPIQLVFAVCAGDPALAFGVPLLGVTIAGLTTAWLFRWPRPDPGKRESAGAVACLVMALVALIVSGMSFILAFESPRGGCH